MADRLIVFEDTKFADFYPLTLNRPVFSLRCGIFPLWERIVRKFPTYQPAFSCRPEVAALFAAHTGHTVNRLTYNPGDRLVFINGRLRLGEKLTEELTIAAENRIYHQDAVTAAIVITGPLKNMPSEEIRFTGEGAPEALGITADMVAGEFEFYDYLWDCYTLNGDDIVIDFLDLQKEQPLEISRMIEMARIDSSARILSDADLYLAPGAEIGAGAVIDNRRGPVVIDKNAVIGPLSYLEGPCYIGPDTRIYRGNIRAGCSFGPCCRVGGEVEQSIFQGYTNKYHDGFMGHAYVGSWVNLGAMTTNSDLKNNYKNISVQVNGRTVETGLMKVGCVIGDHSKTGIGTLINTGVAIGFSCNIFGGTLVTSREVPSFSWGDERGYDIYRLDKAIEVARITMARRDRQFTEDDERIFQNIYEQTTVDR